LPNALFQNLYIIGFQFFVPEEKALVASATKVLHIAEL